MHVFNERVCFEKHTRKTEAQEHKQNKKIVKEKSVNNHRRSDTLQKNSSLSLGYLLACLLPLSCLQRRAEKPDLRRVACVRVEGAVQKEACRRSMERISFGWKTPGIKLL